MPTRRRSTSGARMYDDSGAGGRAHATCAVACLTISTGLHPGHLSTRYHDHIGRLFFWSIRPASSRTPTDSAVVATLVGPRLGK